MSRKIRGLVTQRYAYSDPSKPQCFIKKDEVYEEVNLGVAMVNRILELKGAVILGDLQPLNLQETGFIPEDEDSEESESLTDQLERLEEDLEDDSEEDNSEEEEPEAEQAEAKTRRKDKNSKRKGKNK